MKQITSKRKSAENHFYEILDKRFRDIRWGRKSGKTFFKFTVEANHEYNPNDVDIEYTVNFTKPKVEVFPVSRDGVSGKMRIIVSNLTFENNLTKYNALSASGYRDINSSLLFSSVSKAVTEYFEKEMSSAHAVSFAPASEKLRKAYKILSREAEKRGELVWASKDRSNGNFLLVRKDIWEKFVERMQG